MVESTAIIVEDSLTQAQIVSRMVESRGWLTHHCATIRDASETLQAMTVQAVFLDVFIGQHNGLLHLDRFKKLAPGVPIIVMTAGSSQEDIEVTLRNARKAGADYVLKKPFTEAMLTDIFETAYSDLDRRQRRRHVLVIDDSSTIRKLVGNAYRAVGCRVSEAPTMEDAFENVDIAHVDLAVCDLFMPGMGGFQGMRQIKSTWPKVKIIAMSAGLDAKVSDNDALNAARKIGADAQITKPFSPDVLLDVTADLVPDICPNRALAL